MTNKAAFFLAALIAIGIIADQVLLDGTYLLFLSKKLLKLIEILAFWR
jgi:hypothetical protein